MDSFVFVTKIVLCIMCIVLFCSDLFNNLTGYGPRTPSPLQLILLLVLPSSLLFFLQLTIVLFSFVNFEINHLQPPICFGFFERFVVLKKNSRIELALKEIVN